MKLEHYLTPYQKKTSKWTKALMQDGILKNSYRGKLGRKLDINLDEKRIFFKLSPRAMEIKTNV